MSPWGYQQQKAKVENSMRQIIWFLQQINVKIERKKKRGTHKSVGTVIDLKIYIYPCVWDSDSNKPTVKRLFMRRLI